MTKINIKSTCTFLIIAGLLLLGCDEVSPQPVQDAGPGSGDTGLTSCDIQQDLTTVCNQAPAAGSTVNLSDAHNYQFSSTLGIKTVAVPGNNPNLVFDWSMLTQDLLGHALNTQLDIDMILLTLWNLPSNELMRLINIDQVEQQFMTAVIQAYADDVRTSESIQNFTAQRTPLSWDEQIKYYFDTSEGSGYDPATYTHMVMASTGEVSGQGARMLLFLTLDDSSTTTTINITNDSTTLDYTVNMKALNRLPLAVGAQGLINVEWQYITNTAMGYQFGPNQITEVAIAQYASMNVCDFENNFLEMDMVADQWYEASIEAGTSVAFQNLARADGTPFQGIDANGTWILVLVCGMCNNPAPWFITVLHPC